MNETDRKAFDILKSFDPQFYVDMTDPLETGLAYAVSADADGVLLDISGTWTWAARTEKRAVEIAEIIKEYMERRGEDGKPDWTSAGFVSHDNVGLKAVSKILGGIWYSVPCYVAARFSSDPYIIETDGQFRMLTHEYDNFVWQHYNAIKDSPDGISYARQRIDAGMYGIFVNNICAGFIGTHPEGTMGLLEILPEYRRRGYGKALEQYLANKLLEQGRIPYCHILENNSASLALQKELGMWISNDSQKVYWMW